MKTSTLLKPVIYFFFLATLFTACKKDPVLTGLEGTWIGEYKFTNGGSTGDFNFVITPGNKVELKYGDNSDGKGTYSVNGNTFNATIHSDGDDLDFIFEATYTSGINKLEGTYGLSPSKTDIGTWYLDKQ